MDIFLGEPTEAIKQFIIATYGGQMGHPETIITFTDNSVSSYNWSGDLTQQLINEAGLYDYYELMWLKDIKSVDVGNTVTKIGAEAFVACNFLQNVSIPSSVSSIGSSAFSMCFELSSVSLANGVSEIEYTAFNRNVKLQNLHLPSSITSISEEAFFYCSSLTDIYIDKTVSQVTAMDYSNCGLGQKWDSEEIDIVYFRVVIHCTDGDITIN